ncbi:nucleotidyltransferase family protein [Mesobacillus subterraneus]|uniref:Nucleotidyltransferase family protein n=2 Tax=Mesobacillus subterraneus TaxID=285983 RepID=A0A427TKB0_9BACI|nr:nucleotidyltransferase family protein [Mesobacillus subterraneus]
MTITSEQDILDLIKNDLWMMDIINTASTLKLNDWCVCAGFVRSKIWDVILDFDKRTVLSDVDVIFHDVNVMDESEEKRFETILSDLHPGIPWSVKNQARMHQVNNIPPYVSSADAISKFPETATALGITLNPDGSLKLIAPHGIEDVVKLKIKPTPYFKSSEHLMKIFSNRVKTKNWESVWNGLKVELE